jgi:hypothetical protein
MIELESVTVYRGDTDRKGNVSKAASGSVDVAFGWGGLSRSRSDYQESADTSPQIYAVRGTDIQARDRIERSNGERYSVIGHPLWWQPNELEVFGFVWVVFQVEAMNG